MSRSSLASSTLRLRFNVWALLALLSLPAGATDSPPWAPAIDWTADLTAFRRELPARHKDLFFAQDRAHFDAAVDLLRAELPGLAPLGVALRLQEITLGMGDDHSGVDWVPLAANEPFVPLSIRWFRDGWRVLGTDKVHASLLGRELVALGGVPMAEVERRFARILSHGNPWLVKHRLPNVLALRGVLRHLGLGGDEGLDVTFVDDVGDPAQVQLPYQPAAAAKSVERVHYQQKSLPYAWANQRSILRYRLLPEERIFYVLYNRCDGREVAERMGRKETAASLPSLADGFREVAAQLRSALAAGQVDKLVFDVQFNPGGASDFGTRFAEDLARIDVLREPGRVFVILGRRTFSSAIINAMDFKRLLGATFVGEPPSGTPNHFGEVRTFTLPSSGLRVWYSTERFGDPDGAFEPLTPDLPAEMAFADFAAGRDPVLEAIRRRPVGQR